MNYINDKRSPQKLNGIVYRIVLLLMPLITLMVMESMHRGSFPEFFGWGMQHFLSLAVTYLFLLALMGILFIFPRPIFLSLLFVQFFFWIFVAFASYKKYLLRGDYVSPFDIHLLRELTDISKYLGDIASAKMIIITLLTIIVSVISIWLLLRLGTKTPFKKRLIISAVSVIFLVLLINFPAAFNLNKDPAIEMNEKYEKYGFIGAFLTLKNQAKNDVIKNDYNKESIERIMNGLNEDKHEEVETDIEPNVIVILAEALWDPLLLENVKFKKDPIPYFRSLTENYSSGDLLTHVFGGGTINSELEILTGLTTRFLPEGQEGYHHDIIKPIDSLAHVYKDQGYNTTAVHAFTNWFYSRNEMYKWLGFEKFVSKEFFNNPNYIGLYVDDHDLMEQVLFELEKTEGPDFMNVATVTSHGPYEEERYDKLPNIIKDKGNLSKESQDILNLYAQLLKEMDDSFKLLIEGIEQLDEPTMVVIYGDHLPMLGENYSVYKEAGYFENNGSYEEYLKMYSTPLLVWDNYSDSTEREDLRMTPNFLGSYILSKSGTEKSPIFQISGDLYNKGIKTIPRKQYYSKEDVKESELKDYKLLQYDSLYGDQYGYEKRPLNIVESYILGSEKMQIESAMIKKNENGNDILDITGEGFVSEAIVSIDGEKHSTSFINSNNIQSDIPEKYVNQPEGFTITIQVIDNTNIVLSEVDFYLGK